MTKADIDFDRHFDSCDQCKRAFHDNNVMDGLCDDGVVLCDKSFESRDGALIATFSEEQVRRELSLGGWDSKLAVLTRKRLEARLVALGVKP